MSVRVLSFTAEVGRGSQRAWKIQGWLAERNPNGKRAVLWLSLLTHVIVCLLQYSIFF